MKNHTFLSCFSCPRSCIRNTEDKNNNLEAEPLLIKTLPILEEMQVESSSSVIEVQYLDDGGLEEMLKTYADNDNFILFEDKKENENLDDMSDFFSDFDDLLAKFFII